jgi:hypothetical protein
VTDFHIPDALVQHSFDILKSHDHAKARAAYEFSEKHLKVVFARRHGLRDLQDGPGGLQAGLRGLPPRQGPQRGRAGRNRRLAHAAIRRTGNGPRRLTTPSKETA